MSITVHFHACFHREDLCASRTPRRARFFRRYSSRSNVVEKTFKNKTKRQFKISNNVNKVKLNVLHERFTLDFVLRKEKTTAPLSSILTITMDLNI